MIVYFSSIYIFYVLQADVETTFKIKGLERAEVFDSSWTNPQILCSKKGALVKGGLGPFGLKVLASKGLEEYTAVFFRIFKGNNNKYVVLMCSDQSRSLTFFYFLIYIKTNS